jgi:4-amino-4-deoxychorismate lyase
MCLLFETIRIENGVPLHLVWHEERMNRAIREIWQAEVSMALSRVINVPGEFLAGLVRCNIMYGPEIRSITFKAYLKRRIRSLKLLACNSIDYHVKYADRNILDSLFELRETFDDVIVVKNGLITDTSNANLIFFDGKNWLTPANPLLKGTCRNRLVASGWLEERDIRPGDLVNFTGCKLINALRYPEEEELIPVSEIF